MTFADAKLAGAVSVSGVAAYVADADGPSAVGIGARSRRRNDDDFADSARWRASEKFKRRRVLCSIL